jgi:hypothetical protein
MTPGGSKTAPYFGNFTFPAKFPNQLTLLVAVVANGLHWAAFQRLHAQIDIFLRARLFVDERIATLVMPGKKSRGGFTAQVAIDALLIDVKLAWDIRLPFVCFVGHSVGCRKRRNERRGVKRPHFWGYIGFKSEKIPPFV